MRISKLLAGVALCATLAAGGAQASTVLFSDNFDAEFGGASHLNHATFANWTVTGQVDLVRSPDYGIACSGSCVDLDGTSGPGAMTSSTIAYTGGQLVTIEFDMSGSQRSSASDLFNFTANFNQSTDILGFAASPSFVGAGSGDYFGITTLGLYAENVAGTTGFVHYALSFTPTANGSLYLYFGTSSADNVGPLIDNVLVASGAVPEPATWALMICGFGLAGSALRRRQAVAA